MLLTRESFGNFGKVHHRMPVLLEDNEVDIWLDTDNNNFLSIVDKIILD
jgi:putative SOS response-associated peptidase YedK